MNGWSYAESAPTNWIDPSGYTIRLGDVPNRAMYSCRCGWIDWEHAESYAGFLREIYNAVNDLSAVGDVDSNRVVVSINFGQGIDANYVVHNRTSLLGSKEAINPVALGMYISTQNLVEHNQGQSNNPLTYQSSFSTEDLVSNLIGFHRGVDEFTNDVAPSTTQERYMSICGVVGFEYYKSGDMETFALIQRTIYNETINLPLVGNHYVWGTVPPIGRWYGSFKDKNCTSIHCNNFSKQLPGELLRITPKSPGDGWNWLTTTGAPGLTYAPYFGGPRVPIKDPIAYLNSRPLNWLTYTGY